MAANVVTSVEQATKSRSMMFAFCRASLAAIGNEKDDHETDEGPVVVEDVNAEAFVGLHPECVGRRKEELNSARNFAVPDEQLPSLRMWGREEILKRIGARFHGTDYTPRNRANRTRSIRCCDRPCRALWHGRLPQLTRLRPHR